MTNVNANANGIYHMDCQQTLARGPFLRLIVPAMAIAPMPKSSSDDGSGTELYSRVTEKTFSRPTSSVGLISRLKMPSKRAVNR